MQTRVTNGDLRRLRQLIDDGLSVKKISEAMKITVDALKPFMPQIKKEPAPVKKRTVKKRTVKKKVKTDDESS